MAFGSLIFQGASFVTLVILKPLLTADNFAFFITQLSLASIIGSIATLRFEILLFQDRGKVDRETLLTIFVITLIVLSTCALLAGVGLRIFGGELKISSWSFILSAGFGLIEAQSFLCVQMNRMLELVITRAVQAALLGSSALLVWFGLVQEAFFGIYSLAVTIPLVIWLAIAVGQAAGRFALHAPSVVLWKRSVALTLSVLVNTVYANIAVILASATQPASFVADFGFIMRLLTGPITLIRQAYGHTYLADAFRLEREFNGPSDEMWDLTKSAIKRSILAYCIILVGVIASLLLFNRVLNISRISMIPILSFVTIGQVGINTVANVRSPIKRESAFLKLDFARVVILACALSLGSWISFDILFSVVSTVLYGYYVIFIRNQIGKWTYRERIGGDILSGGLSIRP